MKTVPKLLQNDSQLFVNKAISHVKIENIKQIFYCSKRVQIIVNVQLTPKFPLT